MLMPALMRSSHVNQNAEAEALDQIEPDLLLAEAAFSSSLSRLPMGVRSGRMVALTGALVALVSFAQDSWPV